MPREAQGTPIRHSVFAEPIDGLGKSLYIGFPCNSGMPMNVFCDSPTSSIAVAKASRTSLAYLSPLIFSR
eukprot:15439292-Alexandrium_andersonii.AAC.1